MKIGLALKFASCILVAVLSTQAAFAQQPESGMRDPFNSLQNRPRFDDRHGPLGQWTSGPIGPVEKASLPPNSDSIIAVVPIEISQAPSLQMLPPMWMRVCRTNTASQNQNMFVRADGEVSRLVYPRCIYAAFRTRVTIGTTANDNATVEYQLMGRY